VSIDVGLTEPYEESYVCSKMGLLFLSNRFQWLWRWSL